MSASTDPSIYGALTGGWMVALAVLSETTFAALVWVAVLCVVLVFGYIVRGLVDEWIRTG
ncbi:hypothetical protein [Natronococcus wangiae]|uniref:hypothetical protein n=1 Tax=Natronococcus wangiae TaxID=3068275 RepID=UPI00273DE3EF|nr:hypothetical protein [Natronococcus sp. AD5]